jgi:hypothetical protein
MSQTKINVGMIDATSIADTKLLQGDGAWVTPAAASGDGFKFISTTDISSAATYNFTAVDASSYDGYGLFLQNVIPATDLVKMWFRTSSNAGVAYDAGASDYGWFAENWGTAQYDGADNQINMAGDAAGDHYKIGSDANEDGISGWIWVCGPHLTKYTMIRWDLSMISAHPSYTSVCMDGSGTRLESADVDAFQFLFSSGNIESGTITVYGLANA